MEYPIRAYEDKDLKDILEICVPAWRPVCLSFREILSPQIFPILYPDWDRQQQEGAESVCKNREKFKTLVAECDGKVIGFLSYKIKGDGKNAEVILLGVHPGYQNEGAGTDLNRAALEEMKAVGMEMAVVETGGDSSNAPARRCYEKAGYTALPIVRYFQALQEV